MCTERKATGKYVLACFLFAAMFHWYQIFALDAAVVEVQEMFSSHGGLLTNAMYSPDFQLNGLQAHLVRTKYSHYTLPSCTHRFTE